MHKVPLEGGLFAMKLTSASGATRLTKTEHTESLFETGEMWFVTVWRDVFQLSLLQCPLGTVEAVPLPSQGSIAI